MAEAIDNTCMLMSLDTELMNLKGALETKLGPFAKTIGGNCSVFGTVGNLLGDSAKVAAGWEKDIKMQMADIVSAGSNIYKAFDSATGIPTMTASGIKALKDGINTLNASMDAVGVLSDFAQAAVVDACSGMKVATCDAMSTAVKGIPPSLIAGAAGLLAVQGKSLSQKINGMPKIGVKDLKDISKDAMERTGITDQINELMTKKKEIENLKNSTKLDELRKLTCVLPGV
jgi:hypothetical protein